ncbi:hypothetical protein Syun_016326 [Stephania yunnanensis]|uniref:Uncharacterized protein n=1 Tax=Stephania yunnanensis TaxID=152371 RepID=A0AAP0J4U0_9MAGN
MALVRSKVTEAEPVCLVVDCIDMDVRLEVERIAVPRTERPSLRAQAASYRRSKELGQKSKDLDKGSRAQIEDVQGRELSVHKTPMTQPESSSSYLSKKNREQGVEEGDSTKKEIREESGSEDEDDDNDGNEEGETEEEKKKKKKGEQIVGYTRASGRRKRTT